MVAEHLAMVRGNNHQCAIVLVRLLEEFDNAADIAINFGGKAPNTQTLGLEHQMDFDCRAAHRNPKPSN